MQLLSHDQIEAVKRGEAVRLSLPETGPVIVLRADAHERLCRSYDEGDWTEEELSLLAAQTFNDADRRAH
ncbi:MAG: hypothetical protein KY476_09330 [Planctomycetes bacterium]|nr:hypothetical protein [Planctomycetota bacterium]